jgi:hypothetical protein
MRNILLALLLTAFCASSCSDEEQPDSSDFFFEVEIDGQVFRQEFSKSLGLNEMPLIFEGNKTSTIGQINARIDRNCLNTSCIMDFYVNMVFDSKPGTREIEVVEQIQVPTGNYTSHYWWGDSNEEPAPSSVTMTIIETNELEGVIKGSFAGEVYKTQTSSPIKTPIKGSFYARYLIQ